MSFTIITGTYIHKHKSPLVQIIIITKGKMGIAVPVYPHFLKKDIK